MKQNILQELAKTPSKNLTGYFVRQFRPTDRGLLLIYGIHDLEENSKYQYGSVTEEPYIAYAIGFPRNPEMKKMRMRVNSVYAEQGD